jgi:uncharacterized protein with HEPN domain
MEHETVIRHVEIVGEAVRCIISGDPDFTKRYPALELETS